MINDAYVIRRFAQKFVTQKQALDLSKYVTPEVLGTVGGAAAGGLGAMGLQKLLRSKDEEERGEGSYLPAILGALAGGAGGNALAGGAVNEYAAMAANKLKMLLRGQKPHDMANAQIPASPTNPGLNAGLTPPEPKLIRETPELDVNLPNKPTTDRLITQPYGDMR